MLHLRNVHELKLILILLYIVISVFFYIICGHFVPGTGGDNLVTKTGNKVGTSLTLSQNNLTLCSDYSGQCCFSESRHATLFDATVL